MPTLHAPDGVGPVNRRSTEVSVALASVATGGAVAATGLIRKTERLSCVAQIPPQVTRKRREAASAAQRASNRARCPTGRGAAAQPWPPPVGISCRWEPSKTTFSPREALSVAISIHQNFP